MVKKSHVLEIAYVIKIMQKCSVSHRDELLQEWDREQNDI